MGSINITGARVHNLKGFDISIPKKKLVVATGVSGSGKSSLVYDIIFEEGRRQYLQSLGILFGIDDEHKFDSISGIGPAIAVQQSIIRQSNPRSTVGSRTRILGMLALLFAGEGKILCTACGAPVDANLRCGKCGNVEERLEASFFSYNAPNGMCLRCSGRGAYFEMDMAKLVPDERTTVREVFDAIVVTPGYAKLLLKNFGDYLETSFFQLPDEVKEDILYGHHVPGNYAKRSICLTRIFEGHIYRQGEDPSGIYSKSICADCNGSRIGEEARRVLLHGRHIGELGMMSLTELQGFLEALPHQHSLTPFGTNLLSSILGKTNNLIKTRLGHLSLYREIPTLSGGELQRLFLNAHLDTKMDSLIYVLDEPTMGLHESEKTELLASIVALQELGNTVIVVEHDRNTIEIAEHIIDMGPRAGVDGGRVVYQGDMAGLLRCEASITGRYLSGKAEMPARQTVSLSDETPRLTLRNANTNNLKSVTVSIPLGVLVGVAGVSGSGKSSLISNTLVPLLKRHFRDRPGHSRLDLEVEKRDGISEQRIIQTGGGHLEGVEQLSAYAEVSQDPIGRKTSSNPASYIGIWDKIRKLFAAQQGAAKLNLSAGHFSFNSKGACTLCSGSGSEKMWLGSNFFMYRRCTACHGKRFNDEALSVRYSGKNISDVLEMSVAEAVDFFEDAKGIIPILNVLDRIGMGYIKLGQPTPTLSGGEAQRIKLAKAIGRRRKGNVLFVLDEPTTGLSLYDTARLIQLMDELIAKGNSIIVIEHDPAVLSICDWIIELGPEGGTEGGRIVAEGSPQTLKNNPASITGKYLTTA